MNIIRKKLRARIHGIRFKLRDIFLRNIINVRKSFFSRLISIIFFNVLDEKKTTSVGSLSSELSFISFFSSSLGMKKNINVLGNSFSENNVSDYDYVRFLEKEVVQWNKKIINCDDDQVEGYVTTGGTESNLYLMWSGREYLLKKNDIKPVVLCSDFTHYSIKKSAKILTLPIYFIPIEKNSWSIDTILLGKKVKELYKNGCKSVMIPITIGYSSIGTSDSIEKINNILTSLKRKYIDLEVFVWVDAAAQGIVKSFLDDSFSPFSHSLIMGYVLDYHKLGRTTLSSGLVLYKKELREIIEEPIEYLKEFDATVLGSRPGSSVLSIWANTSFYSVNDWKNYYKKLDRKKNTFVRKIKKIFPQAKIINEKSSLTIGIIIDNNFPKLSKRIESRYGLIECNVANIKHYKLHFTR